MPSAMMAGKAFWWLFGAVALATLVPTGGGPVPARWAKLNDLHPQARARFLALFLAMEAAGYQVLLTSGYRGGTAATGYHYFGLAVDFNIINMATGKQLFMADTKATWEATGIPALIRAHGFRWGGDFHMEVGTHYPHGIDPVHADLGKVYDITKLRTKAKALAKTTPLTQFDGRKVPLTA